LSFEKLMILESKWSDDIADTRSSTEIYTSVESLLSLHDEPVRIINRPLLSGSYLDDINQFVSLESNKSGPNIIVMAAHGSHTTIKRNGKTLNRRVLEGYDDKVHLSEDMKSYVKKYGDNLKRTIFILDSCQIGTNISGFLKVSKCYGVVGFSKNVDWIDSAVFMLALVLKFQSDGVFQLKRAVVKNKSKPEKILDEMKSGFYAPIMKGLGVEYKFSTGG
jgi:hypothetical protein